MTPYPRTGSCRFRPAEMAGSVVALLGACLLSVLAVAATPSPATAQQTPEELERQAEQLLGRDLSDEEILDLLRQLGMTSEQIRDRLAARGFPRDAADAWLRVLEGRASQVPPGTNVAPLVSVLAGTEVGERAGLHTGRVGRISTDSLGRLREPEYGPPVFGREIFRRATSQFQPPTTGPVPPDYVVGPGDQLVLVLTGAVEQAYELRVSREGWVVVPDVGRIFVNGRTVRELRQVLRDRLSQSYSSLEGENPSTSFDVTLGELRTNQVYVIGEVEQPSAYTVSSLATALTALYLAGGPTRNGSFRDIRVNRGGRTVGTIDLYDYLLEGRSEQDVRLQHGDVLFVPIAHRQVRVEGPVSRPAIYEAEPGEGLRDVLRYAGGVEPTAELSRVQIRRVLPPSERQPGRDRVVLDIPVGSLESPADSTLRIELHDGDEIQVFAVIEEFRNRVTVSGAVWRPGTYGAGENTRIWDVIEAAGGLLPDAVSARAQIQRLDDTTDTRRMIPISLGRDEDGEPVENPLVEGMDQILVYARRNLREERSVTIDGWVRQPGVYPLVEGMTVADLILRAGGVRTGVYTARAEVARPVRSQDRTETLSRTHSVSLDSSYVFEPGVPPAEELGGEAATFVLLANDAVYVRRAPGYEERKRVIVTGEVRFPGPFSIESRGERLTELLTRAGGVTEDAYVEGFQLWRAEADTVSQDSLARLRDTRSRQAVLDSIEMERQRSLVEPGGDGRAAPAVAADSATRGTLSRDSLLLAMHDLRLRLDSLRRAQELKEGVVFPGDSVPRLDSAQKVSRRVRVGIDFARALENPDGRENVLVEPGDSIHVPRYNPTVAVRGAVGVETRALWKRGAGLDHYIDQAGGYLEEADEGRVWIRFANGEVATRGGKFLFFGGGIPDPDPGSTINVPFEPPKVESGGLNTGQFLGILTSITTALIVAISR